MISEVEQVCDRALILRGGHLVHTQVISALRRQHRIRAQLTGPLPPLPESFDGNAVATLTQDIATSYLGGSQSAYFGFTGGTGGLHNLQEVHLASLKGWLI